MPGLPVPSLNCHMPSPSKNLVCQVPPMPVAQARQVLEGELGGVPVEEVFEWIDFEKPLGSASVAQVPRQGLCNDASAC